LKKRNKKSAAPQAEIHVPFRIHRNNTTVYHGERMGLETLRVSRITCAWYQMLSTQSTFYSHFAISISHMKIISGSSFCINKWRFLVLNFSYFFL
jgi:hypothetical protein